MEGSALSLDGKVAIVTGAAGGIGLATTRLMVARGAHVVMADIAIDRAAELAAEIGDAAAAQPLDLADPGSVQAMVDAALERFGRLDILHNNAAHLGPNVAERDSDVEHMDTSLWDTTFAVNVRGAMLACRAALPHLAASGNGAIVNTVSNLALQGHVISGSLFGVQGGVDPVDPVHCRQPWPARGALQRRRARHDDDVGAA